MLYCLDCFGEDGSTGRRGTSRMAMMFLSNWLNGYGETGHLGGIRAAICRAGR